MKAPARPVRSRHQPLSLEAIDARLAVLEHRLDARAAEPAELPIAAILSDAAFLTGRGVRELTGDGKDAPTARVRQAVYWAAREATGRSLPVIGRAMGGRDHTTILSGIRRAEKRRMEDPHFRILTERLLAAALVRGLDLEPEPSR